VNLQKHLLTKNILPRKVSQQPLWYFSLADYRDWQRQDVSESSVAARKTSYVGSPTKLKTRCDTSTAPSQLRDTQLTSQSSDSHSAFVGHRNTMTPVSDEISSRHSVVKTEKSNDEKRSEMVPGTSMTSFYHCDTCDIYFGDLVMHALHAGCHGRLNQLECNTCGVVTQNRHEFASHLARGNHCRRLIVPL